MLGTGLGHEFYLSCMERCSTSSAVHVLPFRGYSSLVFAYALNRLLEADFFIFFLIGLFSSALFNNDDTFSLVLCRKFIACMRACCHSNDFKMLQ